MSPFDSSLQIWLLFDVLLCTFRGPKSKLKLKISSNEFLIWISQHSYEKTITCHDCHGFKWQNINIYPLLTIFLCGLTPFLARCIVVAPCHPNWSWSSMMYASNHSKFARWECKEAFCTTFLNKILVTHIVMLVVMKESFRDLSMLVELARPSLKPMNHEMHSTSCYSIFPSRSSNFELVWLFFLFWTLDNVWFMTHLLTWYFY
jgi:hypothetical protein